MIQDYLKAGYPVLSVRTHEPERFINGAVQQDNGRTPYQWDVVRGFRQVGNGAEWQECDPFDLPNAAAKGTEKAVWFLRNFHFWINEPPVIQAIQNNLSLYKTKGITLVIVSPEAKLPLELEREVVVLDYPLPSRAELKSILAGLVESTGIEPEDEAAVLDAAQGLTWEEAENAMALALVRQTRVGEPGVPKFIRDWLSWGAGPRAVQNLIIGGKARALLFGRVHVLLFLVPGRQFQALVPGEQLQRERLQLVEHVAEEVLELFVTAIDGVERADGRFQAG